MKEVFQAAFFLLCGGSVGYGLGLLRQSKYGTTPNGTQWAPEDPEKAKRIRAEAEETKECGRIGGVRIPNGWQEWPEAPEPPAPFDKPTIHVPKIP
ncbi:hypothetical protein IAD21_00899 [Abditibacteriota bacterium]|nr:hypothetical protein IAD21_00899 [Abditibacteriota bacterium]